MESDKKVLFLVMMVTMLFVDSTSYPKSFIILGGVAAARGFEAIETSTTSYNVINGVDGTINDNGPDNVGNSNTSSQELPPSVSVSTPSTEISPPTSISTPSVSVSTPSTELSPPTSISTPSVSVSTPSVELSPPTSISSTSDLVPVELPPPISVSTPSNVVPVYGGRYGFPAWWPIEDSEIRHGDSRSGFGQAAAVKKQKQPQP